MMDTVVDKIVNTMIEQDAICEADKEKYTYSVTIFVEKMISLSLLILLAYALDMLIETMVVWVAFSLLRGRTGGFHLSSFMGCLGISIVCLAGGILLIKPIFDQNIIVYFVGTFIFSMIIFGIGAVNHPNMHWNAEELNRTKKIARMTIVMLLLISVIIYHFSQMRWIGSCIVVAMMIVAFSMMLAKLLKQEVSE